MAQGNAPAPPGQPASGPGGSDYPHAQVVRSNHPGQVPAQSYILYEPGEPTPQSAPVVVFLQGFGPVIAESYQGWIDHIVKKGSIVIFPAYTASGEIPESSRDLTENALTAVEAALKELQRGQHVRPERDHFALVGHSCGGVIAANIAALAASRKLPTPSALMPTSAGCNTPPEDYSQIPASIRMVIMLPESGVAGNAFSKYLWDHTPQIPLENKDYLILRSDFHGRPALIADHNTPVTGHDGSKTNALDYYGTWKVFEALTCCAWYGTNCDYALGGGPNQITMGSWSDGQAVATMVETKENKNL